MVYSQLVFLLVICDLLSALWELLELPCQPHTPRLWYNNLGQVDPQ